MGRWTGRIGAAVVVASCGVFQSAAWAFSVTYDQQVTLGHRVMRSKVMVADQRARIESTMEGIEHIILKNDHDIYSYMPKTGVAMRLPSLEPSQGVVEHPEDYLGYLNEHNAKLIGSETVNGYACDVYTFVDPTNRAGTKVWVWKEKQFPVKLEQQTPEGTMLLELTNIQLDTHVPDSAFELPSGVQLMDVNPAAMDMGKMMEMMKSQGLRQRGESADGE